MENILLVKERSHEWYLRLGDKLMEIFNARYSGARIKPVGSRKREDYETRKSDYDTRFCFPSGTPDQERIYQQLIELFDDKLPTFEGEKIVYGLGTDRNVVNAKPEVGGKVSFMLVEPEDY